MLNKKILAASIAAAMSNVAVAAVDLDAASPVAAQYAQELAWGQNPILVENTEGTPSYVTNTVGFTISEGTSKYLRYDLEGGATFASQPTLAFSNLGTSQPQATVAVGGVGESYVIFELTAYEDQPLVNEDIASNLQVELQVATYSLPTDVDTIVHYRLYEDAVDAFNLGVDLTNLAETLKNKKTVLATFGAGVSGDFSTANDNTASVDTEFTRFLGDAASVDSVANWNGASVTAETANVGTIDVDQLANAGFFNLNGGALDGADIVGTDPVVVFSGDFSFGDWTVHEVTTTADAACLAAPTSRPWTTVINPNDPDTITMSFAGAQSVLETTDYVLCVDVAALDPTRDDVIVANPGMAVETPYANNRIRKGQYTASLTWDSVTPTTTYDWEAVDGAMGAPYSNNLGYIHYDTITVEIPYLTNLSTYNQRVVIVNDGPTDASYVVEFIAEEGYAATGGSEAAGSVKAGTTSVLRGSNILDSVNEVAGTRTRSRSAAKLFIDGKDDDIQVMIQTVNMNTGATDTEVLNANSVVGKTTNYLDEKTPSSLD